MEEGVYDFSFQRENQLLGYPRLNQEWGVMKRKVIRRRTALTGGA